MHLDYIKGHMGGNLIILLDGRQLPENEQRQLEIALEILSPLRLHGHQAGILFPSSNPNSLQVKIVDITNRGFIPACGGLTQVTGKVLATTDWAERFSIKKTGNKFYVTLETASGKTRLDITRKGENTTTYTNMSAFAELLRSIGIYAIQLGEVQAFRSGYYLVADAEKIRKAFPKADFEQMDQYSVDVLANLQKEYHKATGTTNLYFCLYDTKTDKVGHLRAVYPHSALTGYIEPACGTGSIALAMALLMTEEGQTLGLSNGKTIKVTLETGGDPVLGGPDETTVEIIIEGNKLKAIFSHSFVEITSTGIVFV